MTFYLHRTARGKFALPSPHALKMV